LGTIGLDNEVDRQAVSGPRLGRPGDGHQRSSGPDHACGPPLDVAADDIEDEIDAADVFQGIVLKVDAVDVEQDNTHFAIVGLPAKGCAPAEYAASPNSPTHRCQVARLWDFFVAIGQAVEKSVLIALALALH
jgi:hypothetical protein